MKTMLSAVQPSNALTLGNYLGALKGWVDMQSQYDCLFFAVDMHAITVRQDPATLRDQTYMALAAYLASGIDPKQALVFVQSHVPEHTELGWILNCFSTMGELSRMTQFKDKSAKLAANEGIGVGLFTYPVLMAADILLYGTDVVPVGDDQSQHLQLARDLAIRVNSYVKEDLFKVPEAIIPKVGARIMSLQEPTKKMSKSDPDPRGSVFLLDTDEQIFSKVMKSVTDSGSEVSYDENGKAGIANLLHIHAAVTSQTLEEVVNQYQGKRYGDFKKETAHAIISKIAPIRQKMLELMADRPYLDGVLHEGAANAGVRARKTLNKVYDKLGFLPKNSYVRVYG